MKYGRLFALVAVALMVAFVAQADRNRSDDPVRARIQGEYGSQVPADTLSGLIPGGSMSNLSVTCGTAYSSGTITAGSPPAAPDGATWTASNRIFRDGVPSTCAGKSYPGNLTGGPWFYDAFYFSSATADRCYTMVVNGGTCGSGYNVHPSVFCGSLATGFTVPATNPPNPNGYRGDSGSSPAAAATVTYSFCMPANASFTALFTDNYAPDSRGICNYSFTLNCVNQTCTPDPNCGGGGPPPAGGGSTGTCNLAPIEAKLDSIEPKIDALEAKLDVGVSVNVDALPCQVYRILSAQLPGKPSMAGSRCLGLLPTTCNVSENCVEQ